MTTPHRLVVLKWHDEKFSVHTQNDGGEVYEGKYYRKLDLAAMDWLSRVRDKVLAREPFVFVGEPEVVNGPIAKT